MTASSSSRDLAPFPHGACRLPGCRPRGSRGGVRRASPATAGRTTGALWFWLPGLSLARAYALARHDTVAAGLHPPRTDTMRHDLRDAVRSLLRSPAYTLTAIAVLALGIGATTLDLQLRRRRAPAPAAVSEPRAIVLVFEKPPGGLRNGVATANFLDWRDQNDVFEAIAARPPRDDDAGGHGRDGAPPRRTRVDRLFRRVRHPPGSRPHARARRRAAGARPRRRPVESHVAVRVWRRPRRSSGATSCSMARRSPSIGVLPGGSAFDRGRTEVWRPLVFGSGERARNYHWLQVCPVEARSDARAGARADGAHRGADRARLSRYQEGLGHHHRSLLGPGRQLQPAPVARTC